VQTCSESVEAGTDPEDSYQQHDVAVNMLESHDVALPLVEHGGIPQRRIAFSQSLRSVRTEHQLDVHQVFSLSTACLCAGGSSTETKGATEPLLDIGSCGLTTGSDVHGYAHDAGCEAGEGAPQHWHCEPFSAKRELSVDSLPLESVKMLVTQAAQENPCVSKDCNNVSELVAGLRKDVDLMSKDLIEMHLHIVKMQADLFSETEHRIAAESALSSQFTSGLQELPAKVVSTFLSEFDRQRSVLELCKKAEREMRENGARLQKEITEPHPLQLALSTPGAAQTCASWPLCSFWPCLTKEV